MLGPPQAGKTTQARLLAEALDLPTVIVGELLARHVRSGTPLGERVDECTQHGLPVPDETMHEIARDGLASVDSRHGWVLVGYPRTAQQLLSLREWSTDCGQTLDIAIVLGVTEREVLRRLLPGTRPCESEHLEAWVRNSYQRFSDSLPLLMATLKDHGLLQVVDGHGHVHQVATRCLTLARQVVRARALG